MEKTTKQPSLVWNEEEDDKELNSKKTTGGALWKCCCTGFTIGTLSGCIILAVITTLYIQGK